MNNKKLLAIILAIVLSMSFFFGCKSTKNETTPENKSEVTEKKDDETESKEEVKEEDKKSEEETKGDEKTDESKDDSNKNNIAEMVNVGNLKVDTIKGPTAISVSPIMENLGTNLTIHSSIEEIIAALKKGESDLYFIPSNLYAKLRNSGMKLKLVYSNAGNVLSFLGKDELKSVQDLKGKTVALTGRGAIPEIVLNKLLEANGLKIEDINPVFLASPTEAPAAFKKDPNTILLLPQPFATAIKGKIEVLKNVLDLNKEWQDKELPQIITSVIVSPQDKYEEKRDDIIKFTYLYANNVSKLKSTPEAFAGNVEKLGIVPAKIAEKAIPHIEFVSLTGKALTDKLTEFFNELLKTNPELIGGKIPDYEI